MERIVIVAALVTLAGCAGPEQVQVPDTSAPFLMPPEEAMQPCPTAEREGKGAGVLPDLEGGGRASVMRAADDAARYVRTCDGRHRTLREHVTDHFEQQRPPQDR